MDCSMPGFPVLHHLPGYAQTHVHWISDIIQSSHPLSSPSLYKLLNGRLAELPDGWTSGGVGRKIHLPKANSSPVPCSRLLFFWWFLSNIIYIKLKSVGKEFPWVLWAILANSWTQEEGGGSQEPEIFIASWSEEQVVTWTCNVWIGGGLAGLSLSPMKLLTGSSVFNFLGEPPYCFL